MMALTLPIDANVIAVSIGISLAIAVTNASSEEKGKIVAAKNAESRSANSAICFPLEDFVDTQVKPEYDDLLFLT